MNQKMLVVVGKFDARGGKPSGYATKLLSCLHSTLNHFDITSVNGGTWEELTKLCDTLQKYYVIMWFPDVSNKMPKVCKQIKTIHPKSILITSKRNDKGKYPFAQMVSRSLQSKSNLLLELRNCEDGFHVTILDPLGNVFLEDEQDIQVVASILSARLNRLLEFTRYGSKSVGDVIETPKEPEFFYLVKQYADVFHQLIHVQNQRRLLGNASFRCTKGFPSFRKDDTLFVSRRNIDKRHIGQKGFVGVKDKLEDKSHAVQYFGEDKPSVDSPVQVMLYNRYPDIRYMIHSHAYVAGASFTATCISCGSVEEFEEIVEIVDAEYPDREGLISINLKGHGSLVMAKDVKSLSVIPYISRKIPERQTSTE